MPQAYSTGESLLARLNQTMDQWLKYQEQMLSSLLEIQELLRETRNLIRTGSTNKPSTPRSALHQALEGMSPGRQGPSMEERTIASKQHAPEREFLMTKAMARELVRFRPLLSHLAANLPAHLVGEWQELIRFASDVGASKVSSSLGQGSGMYQAVESARVVSDAGDGV